MGWPKGKKRGYKTGGRVAGKPNALSRTAKENIQAVFDGLGGSDGMLEWAKTNKNDFYRGVYPRILPIDTNVSGSLSAYHGVAIPVSERDPVDAAAGTTDQRDPKAHSR